MAGEARARSINVVGRNIQAHGIAEQIVSNGLNLQELSVLLPNVLGQLIQTSILANHDDLTIHAERALLNRLAKLHHGV